MLVFSQWYNEAMKPKMHFGTWNFLDFMCVCKISHRFIYDVEVEMNNCEKLLEDKVCMNHDYHASLWNIEYSRN